MEGWRQWRLGREKQRDQQSPKRIPLTPTGLLMEGVSTSLRRLFARTPVNERNRDFATVILSAVLLRNATPSVFHQRHIGRVLRSSCNFRGRRLASSRGREPQPGRCPPFWPGDLSNDGGSVAVAGADGGET